MNISEAQAHIKSAVWKAIAKSGLDLSELPEEKLEALIDIVTEASMQELDNELGRDAQAAVAAASPSPASTAAENTDSGEEGERTLWEGRPFMSVTKHYRITDQRLRITDGLMSKTRIDIELIKIQDIQQTQRVSERILNLGDITVKSHDPTNPTIVLDNVRDVQNVHEILRAAMLATREKFNFSYREEM